MPSDLNIILSSIIIFGAGGFLWLNYRRVMTKDGNVGTEHPLEYYTIQRVVRMISIFMVMIVTVLSTLTVLWLSVKSVHGINYWTHAEILSIPLVILAAAVIGLGSGMYIVSILSEEYTTRTVRRPKQFSILYMVLEVFHGPLSHVLMFFGALLFLWAISLTEMVGVSRTESVLIYIGLGIISGALLGFAQIFNLTWKHQMPFVFGVLLGFSLYLGITRIELSYHPFNLFFLMLLCIFSLILIAKYMISLYTKEEYRYEQFEI